MSQHIVSNLKSINCCNCCILRFLQVQSSIDYEFPQRIINKELGIDSGSPPRSKVQKANPCSACLGLLQLDQYGNYTSQIVSDVIKAEYDSDEISFALSLPIALQLRTYSIWLHLSRKFKSYYVDKMMYENLDTFPDEDDLRPDKNIVSLKEAWKMIVAPQLAKDVGKKLNIGTDSSFHVTVNFEYSGDGEETACMARMHPEIFDVRKNQRRKYHNEVFTRKSVEHALERTKYELFAMHSPIPPEIPSGHIVYSSITCSKDSIYIAGRYNKFSRILSQTPWLLRGVRRMETSVEELITAPIPAKILSDGIKFSSSGREDVDVRTLGRGRPFVLDIQNPRRTKLSPSDLKELQYLINSSTDSIRVRDLQLVPKEELVFIKAGETTKTKTYQCVCVVKTDLSVQLSNKLSELQNMKSFVIQQRTPVRVLHRRPLAIRPRTVHWVKGNLRKTEGENTFFALDVKVEAGTYIKELVHGDFGRTVPNISTILGVETDIVALDVVEVDLSWPPSLNES